MSKVLVFDTETTGLPSWRAGHGHICQPDVLQLALLLVDSETDEEVNYVSFLIKDGKPGDEGAVAIHGITDEKRERFGIPRRLALSIFHHFVMQADLVVAHNMDFDYGMLKTMYIREGVEMPNFKQYCTMKALTPLCKLPHKNPNRGRNDNYKWPKLIEAYSMFIDPDGFDGAHDAMVDVRACYEMYKWLGREGHIPGYDGGVVKHQVKTVAEQGAAIAAAD